MLQSRSSKIINVLISLNITILIMMSLSALSLENQQYPLFNTGDKIATLERDSPSDHIEQEQIKVYDDRIILELKDARWSSFADTNSMDPLLDETANGIEIRPQNPSDIGKGDVIAYRSKIAGKTIIHRVVEISEDADGIYYLTKGDNNKQNDPEKIRFEQIEGVLVAIIY